MKKLNSEEILKSNINSSEAEELVRKLLLLRYLKTEDEKYLILFRENLKNDKLPSSNVHHTISTNLSLWSLLLLSQLVFLIVLGLLL